MSDQDTPTQDAPAQDTPTQDAPSQDAAPQGASNLDQVKGEILGFTRGEFFFAAGEVTKEERP